MTNPLALILGVLLLLALIVDVSLYSTEHVVFLGKKLFELIEWMAFWR